MLVNSITCGRCGQCCHYVLGGRVRRCKHLVKLKTGKTLCRIYKRRMGKIIDTFDGKSVVCIARSDSPYDFKDCPYNTGGKPIRWLTKGRFVIIG